MATRGIEDDTAYLAEFNADRKVVEMYFRRHPALVLSSLYFYCSFVGLIYLWVLHQYFGISIASYLDVIDFALAFMATAGIYLPIIVFLLVSKLLTGMVRRYASRKAIKADPSVAAQQQLTQWRWFYGARLSLWAVILMVGVSGMYAVQAALLKAVSIAEHRKYQHRVDLNYPVTLADNSKVMQLSGSLLSVTSRYVFLLPKGQQHPLLIPVANLSAMQRLGSVGSKTETDAQRPVVSANSAVVAEDNKPQHIEPIAQSKAGQHKPL